VLEATAPVIDEYFKSYFWTFRLAALAVLAVLTARAVNVFVGGALRTPPSAIASAPMTATGATEVSHRSEVATQAFLERNIFNAEREDLVEIAAAENAETSKAAFDANQCDKTSLRSKLVGTVVSSERDKSIAVFTDATTSQPVGLYEGDAIEAGKIVSIEWREVKIDHLGRCERFSLLDDVAAPVATAMSDVPAPPDVGNTGDAPNVALGEGVKKVKDDQYEIPRAEIDNVLSNLNAVATQARIVPSFQNGKANGFKLFSIRPNSLYSKIGIQNGDVVQKINGYEINSPDKALEIYSKLKDAQSITVDLIRRGKTQTLNYAIR